MFKERVGAIAPKRINRGLMDGRQGWEKLRGATAHAVCFSRMWGPAPGSHTQLTPQANCSRLGAAKRPQAANVDRAPGKLQPSLSHKSSTHPRTDDRLSPPPAPPRIQPTKHRSVELHCSNCDNTLLTTPAGHLTIATPNMVSRILFWTGFGMPRPPCQLPTPNDHRSRGER